MSEEVEKKEEPKQDKPKGTDVLAVLIDLANDEKYKDFSCFSVSMMTKFEDKEKVAPGEMSELTRMLLKAYITSGKGDKDTFVKAHVKSGLAFIQAHEKLPILADDGLYDTRTSGMRMMKSCAIKGVLMTEPDKFEPFILVRGDKEGDFNIIKGNPFPDLTKDTVEAVKDALNGEE